MYRETQGGEINLFEGIYTIVGVSRLETQEELVWGLRVRGREEAGLYLVKHKCFSFLRSSTDWMRPTHITDSNVFFSDSWFKCSSHLKNIFQQHLDRA